MRFFREFWGSVAVIFIGVVVQAVLYIEAAPIYYHGFAFSASSFTLSMTLWRTPTQQIAQYIGTSFAVLILAIVLGLRNYNMSLDIRHIIQDAVCTLHIQTHYGVGLNQTHEVWATGRLCTAKSNQPLVIARELDRYLDTNFPCCYRACIEPAHMTKDRQWRGWITSVPEFQHPTNEWCSGPLSGKCQGGKVIVPGDGDDDAIELPIVSKSSGRG
jgi:hypothetical protein